MFSPGWFALFQFCCPSAPGAAGASRSRSLSSPGARRSLIPSLQRDSSPRRSALAPVTGLLPTLFFLFLSVSLWMGETAGRREISRGQDQGEPLSSPRFPRVLAFLSLKPCVHKGLASAFQLGNRDLFTFTLSPVPTRIWCLWLLSALGLGVLLISPSPAPAFLLIKLFFCILPEADLNQMSV